MNEYRDRATEIITKMAFYLKFYDSKESYYQKECEKINKWLDCMDLIDRFIEVVKEVENEYPRADC